MMRATSIRWGSERLWQAALAVLAFVALTVSAEAQSGSRVCRQLEAQLASAGSGKSTGQAARYDAAMARQQEQITKARGQARQMGCGRGFFGSAVSACASLNATVDKMQRNLADLQAKRAKMGGGGGRQERARIMASLDVNGCRVRTSSLPAPIEQPRQQAVIDGRTGLRIGGLSGSFRTLCVRTCDGYFFPISYGVSSSLFERDQNACAAMCPGTQVDLYYHRVPGESADMVSASSGLPYSEMQNAWRYRDGNTASGPGCGCGASASAGGERGFEVIGGAYPSDAGQPQPLASSIVTIPMPGERPDPAEDPETLANRDGGLDVETMSRLATPPRVQSEASSPPLADGERAVRVVGPVFLPDPEEAIDLRAPDQPVAR